MICEKGWHLLKFKRYVTKVQCRSFCTSCLNSFKSSFLNCIQKINFNSLMYFKIICFTVFFLFSGSSYSQYIELEYCFKISDDESCVWKIQFDGKTQISSYLLDSDVLYVKTVKILDKNSGDITERNIR